jgi:DNA-binding transcriptional ArsR family regulator
MIQPTLYCSLVLAHTERHDAMQRLGRALADATRCRILFALVDGLAYPAQLADALELTRSNTSNHLACLRGCGIVVAIPEGRQTRYELADPNLGHALTELLGVVVAVGSDAVCSAER